MIYLGSNRIKLMFGNIPIKNAYIGESLIYTDEDIQNNEIWYFATAQQDISDSDIKSHTFSNGKGILQFNNPITTIKSWFINKPITKIELPKEVISIEDSAFSYCSSLTSINIPDSVTSIGAYAFSYCSSLTSINIPDSVTSIGAYAFSYCSSLTSINIPDSVTSIGTGAFNYCNSLTSINIPDSVTSIGTTAFSGCNSLTSINIPYSITKIDNGAFSGCSNLTSVTCEAIIPPSLGYNVFNDTNDCPIYVPSQSVEAYKIATNWNQYASRIYVIS